MANKKYLKMTLKVSQSQNEVVMAEDLVEVDNDTLQNVDINYQRSDNEESQSTCSVRN